MNNSLCIYVTTYFPLDNIYILSLVYPKIKKFWRKIRFPLLFPKLILLLTKKYSIDFVENIVHCIQSKHEPEIIWFIYKLYISCVFQGNEYRYYNYSFENYVGLNYLDLYNIKIKILEIYKKKKLLKYIQQKRNTVL